MARPVALSQADARRLALAAQGLAGPRPAGRVDRRHVRQVFARVGLVQIDSVNVLARGHELTVFGRLGPHRRGVLDAMAGDGELFEYWGHEASLIPVDDEPWLRWRMQRARAGEGWSGLMRFGREESRYVAEVERFVRDHGPTAARDLGGAGSGGPWWDWSQAKLALEYLFWTGTLTARRRPNFERVYDLRERVLPAAVLARPDVAEDDARRHLLARAARALGVAWPADLFDYYRLTPAHSRPHLAELVEAGDLVPARVEGISETAYLPRGRAQPREVPTDRATLVGPFDSVLWNRRRAERLYGLTYRLEIYTPAARRVHGYYVLPFLLGERFVARVDLKADRQAGLLRVQAAHLEPGVHAGEVVAALAGELGLMGEWLGLGAVTVGRRGTLAVALGRELRRRATGPARATP